MEPKVKLNRKTILIIGYLWPYTYGGHRTTKLCRELSKQYEVISLTRPLYKYLDKVKKEPFKIYQTGGLTTIYDLLRILFKFFNTFLRGNKKENFIDSGIVNKLENNKNFPSYLKYPVKLALKIKFLIDLFFGIPDIEWPWLISSQRLLKKIYKQHKPFMVISSYPLSSHFLAAKIKKMNPEIKWISEFPDLWSQNHIYPYWKIRKIIDKKLEQNTLKNCDKIITCQPGWAEKLEKLHNSKIEYIPHCIDLELHNSQSKNIDKNNAFTIRYLGTLYKEQLQYLKIFMEGFNDFIKYLESQKLIPINTLHDQISVEFIGTKSDDLSRLIISQKNKDFFKILPRVSYEESVYLMNNSSLLILPLYSKNGLIIDWFSSKIIDYIGSRNKCLILGEHCDDFKNLTNNNYPLINSKQICLNYLIKLFTNCEITGSQLSIGKNIDLNQFSMKTLSSRFIEL